MPGAVRGAGDIPGSETGRTPCPHRADILVRQSVQNKEINNENQCHWGKTVHQAERSLAVGRLPFYFFLAALRSMRDLSSPTRGGTRVLYIGKQILDVPVVRLLTVWEGRRVGVITPHWFSFHLPPQARAPPCSLSIRMRMRPSPGATFS